MRRGLAALGLALACCTGGPAGPSSPRGGVGPAAKKKQRRPGVNEWFVPTRESPPIDLAGTAADGLAFIEFRRGRFRVWHTRGIAGRRADAIWRAVQSKGGDLVAILARDEVFNEGYYAQFVSAAGAVEREGTLALQQALVIREKQLGERAARMRQALASATPNEGFRRSFATAEHLLDELEADPEGRPFDVGLTVFRGPIEDVTPFLVTGAELEPRPAELAAALRRWRVRHGAIPRRWDGHSLELAVERPPRALAALRELAWQFYLMCPAVPGGLLGGNEPADQLLVRLEQKRWLCSWFVE